jgi:hypothetical protein
VRDGNGNGNGAASRMRLPDLADRLWRFLAENRGEMFCTQCLANALLATRRIDRVVIAAERRGCTPAARHLCVVRQGSPALRAGRVVTDHAPKYNGDREWGDRLIAHRLDNHRAIQRF